MSRRLKPWGMLAVFAILATRPGIAFGQWVTDGEPSLSYYKAIQFYHEGSFGDAIELFQETARTSTRTVDGRWYDSICFFSMLGECWYALGDLNKALDHYNAALEILRANPRWLDRVQFPVTVGPMQGGDRIDVPWRRPDATAIPGNFNAPMQVLVGNLDNTQVARQGGVVAPPEFRLLNVAEVVRCICIAQRRRIEILGPLCQMDPFSKDVADVLADVGGARNQWSQVWVDLQYGLSLAALGRGAEAMAALKRSELIAGTYSHPGTGIALFESGRLLAAEQRYDQAELYFLRASVAAAEFGQFALVEESLSQATAMHIFRNNAEPLSELPVALAWARRQRLRHLTASLLVDSAENLLALGRNQAAAELVAEARRARGRQSGIAAYLAARLEAQSALLAFQNRQMTAANAALAAAVAAQQSCSPWLLQIRIADSWYVNIRDDDAARRAAELYPKLLRDPVPDDWIRNHLDTLTVQVTPHPEPYQRWFRLCLQRGETEQAFQVGEMLRRHRYHSTIPLGGRLLSLRWIMEGPSEWLDMDAQQRRVDLMTRFPAYAALARQTQDVKAALRELPLANAANEGAPDDSFKKRQKAYAEFVRLAETQELLLGEIALRREPIPYVFPPLKSAEAIQASLAPGQAALVFVCAGADYHAFLLSHDGLYHWPLPAERSIRHDLQLLMKALGLIQPNSTVSEKTLTDDSWLAIAERLKSKVIDRSQQDLWKRYTQLVIVPDGALWYLPFELLPASSVNSTLVGSETMISYAPAAGLITAPNAPQTRFPQTMVVAGKMHPRDDLQVVADRISEWDSVVPGLNALPAKLPLASGVARCFWDRLVVLHRNEDVNANVLNWTPTSMEGTRSDGMLARWMQLPWGAPTEVILPGFSSASDSGAKSGDGSEVANVLLSFMAAGSRTVILSRWRVGGQSSFDLVREFLQETDALGPPAAWQRSVQVVRQQTTNGEWEPRISVSHENDEISTSHPFFWAGYLVAHQGHRPAPAETAAHVVATHGLGAEAAPIP